MTHHPARRCTGFSLVEIMVGVAIGILGAIVMMQVFSVSEGYKRTTTGGADAQNNGAIALYTIQRDIAQSGYGISAYNLLGCNVVLRSGVTLNAMTPVTINHSSIPAGDSNTDTLLVVYSSANGPPQGDTIILQPATNTYSVMTPTSFSVNDWIVAEQQTRPSPCSLTMEKLLSVTSPSPPNLTVATGVSGMANGIVYNLGQSPKILAYAIRSGNLTVCDYTANDCGSTSNASSTTIWVPIANNIVSLRAQYGRDTSTPTMDSVVDLFDQITPGSASDASGRSVNCNWSRISAIRLALVARSGQYDKSTVTTTAPTWAGSTADNPTGSTSNPIDLSANSNWQHYRYKISQTVAPIRNMAWMGVQSGC